MELDERGIERAVEEFANGREPDEIDRAVVVPIIEAYLSTPPEWPTRESRNVFSALVSMDLDDPPFVEALRRALLHDPIIKAAVAVRDHSGQPGIEHKLDALLDAVNEAGL